VVIKNGTGKARILTGWTLRDTSSHVYRFPATRLRLGGYLLKQSESLIRAAYESYYAR
jgi:hypothetical protein